MSLDHERLLGLIRMALEGAFDLRDAATSDVREIKDADHLLSNLSMRTLHTDDPVLRSSVESKMLLLARASASATDTDLFGGYIVIGGKRLYFIANLRLREIVIEHWEDNSHWVVKPPAIG